jgi:hypothetical protein
MKKRINTLVLLMGTYGCLLTSCGSVTKDIEEQTKKDSTAFGNGGEDTVEMKDARAEDRVKYRREAAAEIEENEKSLASLKTNLSKTNGDTTRLQVLSRQNGLLKTQLNAFNETLDTNWTVFKNKMDSSLKVVSTSIKGLEVH